MSQRCEPREERAWTEQVLARQGGFGPKVSKAIVMSELTSVEILSVEPNKAGAYVLSSKDS